MKRRKPMSRNAGPRCLLLLLVDVVLVAGILSLRIDVPTSVGVPQTNKTNRKRDNTGHLFVSILFSPRPSRLLCQPFVFHLCMFAMIVISLGGEVMAPLFV
jgi:hypothetical protein